MPARDDKSLLPPTKDVPDRFPLEECGIAYDLSPINILVDHPSINLSWSSSTNRRCGFFKLLSFVRFFCCCWDFLTRLAFRIIKNFLSVNLKIEYVSEWKNIDFFELLKAFLIWENKKLKVNKMIYCYDINIYMFKIHREILLTVVLLKWQLKKIPKFSVAL